MARLERTARWKRSGKSRALMIWQRVSVFVRVGLSPDASLLPKAARPGQPWRSCSDATIAADRGASGLDPPVIVVNLLTWLQIAALGGVVQVEPHIVMQ